METLRSLLQSLGSSLRGRTSLFEPAWRTTVAVVANRPRYTQGPLRHILVLLSQAEGGTAAFSTLVDRLRPTFTPNETDLAPPRYANNEAAWIDRVHRDPTDRLKPELQ
jgi:hypothetical protein